MREVLHWAFSIAIAFIVFLGIMQVVDNTVDIRALEEKIQAQEQ